MTYSNTPNTGDTLGSTKTPINTNFALIQSAMSQNHYGMGTGASTAGKHKIIHVVEQATEGQTAATETAVYSKSGGTGDLFIRSPSHVDPLPAGEYQLTTFSDANISKFGTNDLIGAQRAGWTFLPGGLYLMYGRVSSTANTTYTVNLPLTINTASLVPVINVTGVGCTARIDISSETNTQFSVIITGTTLSSYFYWSCIGKP